MKPPALDPSTLTCPTPLTPDTTQLAHGGGGRAMHDLLTRRILPVLDGPAPAGTPAPERHDAAVLDLGGTRIAFTTDTFVVSPRSFPGGDLGSLAVYGTVNDLACAGATPSHLSCALILEEGFPLDELDRTIAAMQRAAARCNVRIVTGDTKVIERGKSDGLFINTSGVGLVPAGVVIGPRQLRPGDVVLVSGDIGRHGVAIMTVRAGLSFETPIDSDCAPVHELVAALLGAGIVPSCLRDPTRGGLAAALNELALDGQVGLEVDAGAIPVSPGVAAVCELLGLDPLHVACEGRLVVTVRAVDGDRALATLRATPGGHAAARIGTVTTDAPGRVVLRTTLGTRRILDLPSGQLLPRIC